MSRSSRIGFVPALDAGQQAALRGLYRRFGPDEAQAIAAWDRRVNHDVKAVEYWLRERVQALGLAVWSEAIHWALTSEDVNNIAYALLVREARDMVLVPALRDIYVVLREAAQVSADTAMLARTHGQPATPTTLGKELNVWAHRLHRAIGVLTGVPVSGKLNGATGDYAAHVAAMPEIDSDLLQPGVSKIPGSLSRRC